MFLNRSNLIYNLLFIVVVILFAVLKLQAVHLPYFWDELGVYSRSSMYLAEHGLGLLPSNLPPELSRGHPLLFSFIYGIAYKIFGMQVETGHTLSLIVSCTLLTTLFYIISKESNKLIALLSVLLLIVQPVFYAQSVLVLPEILVALFMLWALYSYYRGNYYLFAFFASAALMVKESAIILPVVAAIYTIALYITDKENARRVSIKQIVLIFFPWVVFGTFLIVQKLQNGWFFFPLHIDNVSFSIDKVQVQMHGVDRFLFYSQGRYWWVKVFLVAGVAMALKGIIKPRHSFITVSVAMVLMYIAFSSVNFFMDRYALVALPFMCWLVIESVNVVWKNRFFVGITFLLLSLAAVKDMSPNGFNYDCDMGYVKMLDVEQRATNYACSTIPENTKVAAFFPISFILYADSTTGFKKTCKISTGYYTPDDPQEYILQTVGGYDFTFPDYEYDEAAIFENGFAWVKVWKRKEMQNQ